MQLSASVAETAPPSEKRLAAALQHRYFLRLHMMAILTATILVGLGITRLLFIVHLDVFALRYAIAVLAAWGSFILFVKLWLAYISARSHGGSDWADAINFSGGGSSSSSSSSSSSGSSFGSGGGKFGGAGASGGWSEEGAPSRAAIVPLPPQQQPVSSTSSASSASSHHSGGGSKSSGGSSSDDLGELILVVLIIALVVATVLSFAWMVWAAPGILGETAFNAVLAGALGHHAHTASNGNWVGSVLKKTAIPFVLIFGMAIAVGAWAQHICPQAHRLADAMNCVR